MSGVAVTQTIKIYEINGEDVPITPAGKKEPFIGVNSHWNNDDMVVLKVGKRNYTVVADSLTAAIKNATNVNRY